MDISINVFDIYPDINSKFRFLHLGLYHTSIVINGQRELYFWGDYNSNQSGIRTIQPTSPPWAPNHFKFYRTYYLGKTKFTADIAKKIIEGFIVSSSWKANTYSLIYHNCNHFTSQICEALLTSKQMEDYPFYVQRMETFARFVWGISLSYFDHNQSLTKSIIVQPPESENIIQKIVSQESPRYI